MIGRPVLWGSQRRGRPGARAVARVLQAELDLAMASAARQRWPISRDTGRVRLGPRYDPLGSALGSTLVARSRSWRCSAPRLLRLKAPLAALAGWWRRSPSRSPSSACRRRWRSDHAALGAAYGLLPIGWIVLNVVFLYHLWGAPRLLDALRRGVDGITTDPRLQLLLVAFCFGAFMEGAAGFGTPVAVTGGILIAARFKPLQASGLSSSPQPWASARWARRSSRSRA